MSVRKIPLLNGQLYHVFNRTIAKTRIFDRAEYLSRVFALIEYYQFRQTLRFSKYQSFTFTQQQSYRESLDYPNRLVEIYSFAFMPNHFHFLLRQREDEGIKYFIASIQSSFARYFNILTNRTGGLFQDRFKAKLIQGDQEAKNVIRYIHFNPLVAGMVKTHELEESILTSHSMYVGNQRYLFMPTDPCSMFFSSQTTYKDFIKEEVKSLKKLRSLESQLRVVLSSPYHI